MQPPGAWHPRVRITALRTGFFRFGGVEKLHANPIKVGQTGALVVCWISHFR